MYILFGGSLIVILILLLLLKAQKKKSKEKILLELHNEYEKERRKLKEQLAEEQAKIQQEILLAQADGSQKLLTIHKHNETIITLEKEKLDLTLTNIRKDINHAQEQAQLELSNVKELALQKLNHDLENKRKIAAEAFENEQKQMQNSLNARKEEINQELSILQDTLEDFKKKQEVIGQEILRRRAIEEQQDFYRICLTEQQISDIQILWKIIPKLYNRSNLNKLIYDVYYSKEIQAMIKRVLNGTQPSGIYKITRLKTGEIYVGKSTNVKDRWIQHCKTASGCGSIAHSILHTTMEKDGIQNFTFELLEEVPKDKLSEREKYWINFYKSKEYGMNEKEG